MSEHNQSRKFADKSAAIANETLLAAVEQSAQAIKRHKRLKRAIRQRSKKCETII